MAVINGSEVNMVASFKSGQSERQGGRGGVFKKVFKKDYTATKMNTVVQEFKSKSKFLMFSPSLQGDGFSIPA